jgi:competence protein ComEA
MDTRKNVKKIKNITLEFVKNNKLISLLAIVALVLLFLALLLNSLAPRSELIYANAQEETQNGEAFVEKVDSGEDAVDSEGANDSTQDANDCICVYVCGAVANPGVYYLESGSRVVDSIDAAGGCTEDANCDQLNLALPLEENERIYVPSANADQEVNATSGAAAGTGTAAIAGGKIDINSASASELVNLNGIGEALANRIIDYRCANGKFADIEDLKNVSGIGDKKFESIKDDIVAF